MLLWIWTDNSVRYSDTNRLNDATNKSTDSVQMLQRSLEPSASNLLIDMFTFSFERWIPVRTCISAPVAPLTSKASPTHRLHIDLDDAPPLLTPHCHYLQADKILGIAGLCLSKSILTGAAYEEQLLEYTQRETTSNYCFIPIYQHHYRTNGPQSNALHSSGPPLRSPAVCRCSQSFRNQGPLYHLYLQLRDA